jgi:UDP-2,3-diacylglucosamine pyrophosphatase LpxH
MSVRGYVVGDLHFGAGPSDPLEDFQDDDIFAKFCERISGPETTLILNGDIIDFAQIQPFEVPKPAHLLWTEQASLAKLETALNAHHDCFAALDRLISKGGRVHFLIGNHDLDIVWPRVQARVASALQSPPTRQLAFTVGSTVFHGVHVEHGHHFTPENCPRVPDQFVHAGPGGVPFLERVWGTDFMLRFFNQLERDYPFADNVKPMLTLAWHGLQAGWFGGREVTRLFLFLKQRGIPWSGLSSAVLAAPPPRLTAGSAAAAFDDPQWKRAVVERAHRDSSFVVQLNEGLTELEPNERNVATKAEKVEVVNPRLRTDAKPAATLGIFREDRELRAAIDRLGGLRVTHVVFGHTHAIVDGALKGRLFNPGTWIKNIDLDDAHVKAKIKAEGITMEMLKDDRLYTANRRAVRIDPDPQYESKVRLVSDDAP